MNFFLKDNSIFNNQYTTIMSANFKRQVEEIIVSLKEELKQTLETTYCSEKSVPYNETVVFLLKTEILVFNSIKNNADKSIYSRLLEKYDELMLKTYELLKELVVLGITEEGKYLNHCRNSVERRHFIESFCERAEKGKFDTY